MTRDGYSLADFLVSIEDLEFIEAYGKTSEEHRSIEPLARRELRKKGALQEYRIISYERKLRDLLFWFNSCVKPAGLSDSEFQLIKPLCVKLVEKGNLKETALAAFDQSS